MKSIFFAFSVAAFSMNFSGAFATTTIKSSCFTGFFSGLNIGMSSFSTRDTIKENGAKYEIRNGGFGPTIGLHAGYGVGFGSFGYLGASVYGNFARTKIGASTLHSSHKRTHTIGANLDAGVIVGQNTVVGGGLGLEWARITSGAGKSGTSKPCIRPSLFAKTFVSKNVYLGIRGSVGIFGKLYPYSYKNTKDTSINLEIGYKF
jgi:hypothetical protein